MIVSPPDTFLDAFAALPPPPEPRAAARAAFLNAPAEFALAGEPASDNRYMDLQRTIDPLRALARHAALAQALRADGPVVCVAGIF